MFKISVNDDQKKTLINKYYKVNNKIIYQIKEYILNPLGNINQNKRQNKQKNKKK